MKIIVMGPAGSGKTTQAELLAECFKIPHLDMGELMREFNQSTETGKMIKAFIEKGTLVPDELTLKILAKQIAKPEYQEGFVINGTPRTLGQAQNLPFTPDVVIYLSVGDEENARRLYLRGRKDDTPELIKHRLEIYHKQTEPILSYYREQGKLLEIDGERPVEVIAEDIVSKLNNLSLV